MESIVILDMDMIHFDDTIENLQSVQYQAQNQIQIHQVRDSNLWLTGLERNVTVIHRVLCRLNKSLKILILNIFLSKNVKENFSLTFHSDSLFFK